MNSKTLNRTLLIIKLYREKATNRFIKMSSKCTAYQRQILISDKCSKWKNNSQLLTRRMSENTIYLLLQHFAEPDILVFIRGCRGIFFEEKRILKF